VLRGFRRGHPRILVATNVAARGLDILSIEQVINFDVPESAELLTHRLGRTGRMGRRGSAVTLLTPAEERKWKLIERQIGVRIERERWGQPVRPEVAPEAAARSSEERPDRPARSRSRRSRGPRHEAPCASCGQPAVVSFQPGPDRPVYCTSCFRAKREGSAA
jgi:ATP-dependent RNA helicase DeaD